MIHLLRALLTHYIWNSNTPRDINGGIDLAEAFFKENMEYRLFWNSSFKNTKVESIGLAVFMECLSAAARIAAAKVEDCKGKHAFSFHTEYGEGTLFV